MVDSGWTTGTGTEGDFATLPLCHFAALRGVLLGLRRFAPPLAQSATHARTATRRHYEQLASLARLACLLSLPLARVLRALSSPLSLRARASALHRLRGAWACV